MIFFFAMCNVVLLIPSAFAALSTSLASTRLPSINSTSHDSAFSVSKWLDLGNLTEEYAIVLVALTIWLAIRSLPTPTFWTGLGIGLFGSSAALFKATYITTPAMVGLALLLVMLSDGHTRLVIRIALGGAIGIAVPFILAVAYFIANNALGEAYYAFWTFNIQYKDTISNPLDQLLVFSMNLLSPTAVCVLAIPGWIVALTHVKHCSSKASQLAAYTVVLALPLELFLVVLGGRMYGHYTTMTIPILALSTSVFLDAMVNSRASVKKHEEVESIGKAGYQLIPVALVIGIIALPLMQGFVAKNLANRNVELLQVVSDVQELTDDDDTIQTWQSSPMVYALTGRSAPTRFSFETAFEDHERSLDFLTEFTAGLMQTPPEMIVEQIGRSDLLPPLNRAEMEANISAGIGYSDDLIPLLDFVEENYEPFPAPNGWRYFLLIPAPDDPGTQSTGDTYLNLVSPTAFVVDEYMQRRTGLMTTWRLHG